MSKVKIGVLFGGMSSEHEVSLNSAYSIIDNLNKEKFEVFPIAISKSGEWYGPIKLGDVRKFKPEDYSNSRVLLLPQPNEGAIYDFKTFSKIINLDIIFPVLHGQYGEDGTIQGLLDLAQIPYVGTGIKGSVLGIDKDIMKKIFTYNDFPQTKYLSFTRLDIQENCDSIKKEIKQKLKYPLFIKPANLGSSVGISKVETEEDLLEALFYASKFDKKIVIEEGINAREIETSVLGNDDLKVSLPGEIIPANDFYDYEAKYLNQESRLEMPAQIEEELTKKIQILSKKVFKALDLSGLSRIDFFICKDTNKIYINEVNTLPGFTEISMYPKLWELSGISMTELLDNLVQLGFDNFKEKQKNQL